MYYQFLNFADTLKIAADDRPSVPIVDYDKRYLSREEIELGGGLVTPLCQGPYREVQRCGCRIVAESLDRSGSGGPRVAARNPFARDTGRQFRRTLPIEGRASVKDRAVAGKLRIKPISEPAAISSSTQI
jgi:hypothetical protein